MHAKVLQMLPRPLLLQLALSLPFAPSTATERSLFKFMRILDSIGSILSTILGHVR